MCASRESMMKHLNEDWVKAKKLCRLNQEEIRMAKELGFTPRALMKNIPNKNQPWKAPVNEWIRDLHEKRFRKTAHNTKNKEPEPIESQEWDLFLKNVPLKPEWRNLEIPPIPDESDYFDERHYNSCGICDVCLNKKKKESLAELKDYRDQVLYLLKRKPLSVDELENEVKPTDHELMMEVVREMVDEQVIMYDEFWVLRLSSVK